MNKKLYIAVIVAIIVLIAIIGIVFFTTKKVEMNIQELQTKMAEQEPFNKMATMDITKENLEDLYGIKAEQVDEVIGKVPLMNVQASMYIVVKAKDNEVENVKQKIEEYHKAYEEQWSRYLPAQYELVKNKKMGVKGNYVYLIIAETADKLESLIK